MADSLSTRVGRVIAASASALVSRLENQAPVALMEQAIREVEGIIGEVRRELGQISANRHLAQQQHAHLSTQHSALTEQARQALAENREDLASAAVAWKPRSPVLPVRKKNCPATSPRCSAKNAKWSRRCTNLSVAARRQVRASVLRRERHRRAANSNVSIRRPARLTASISATPDFHRLLLVLLWSKPPSSKNWTTWCATTKSVNASPSCAALLH